MIGSSYLSQKADRDFNQKAYGETPLTLALLFLQPQGNDRVAVVSSRDKLGNTPLHIAALHDQPAIAALLIANGADVNAQNDPPVRSIASHEHQQKRPRRHATDTGDTFLSPQGDDRVAADTARTQTYRTRTVLHCSSQLSATFPTMWNSCWPTEPTPI